MSSLRLAAALGREAPSTFSRLRASRRAMELVAEERLREVLEVASGTELYRDLLGGGRAAWLRLARREPSRALGELPAVTKADLRRAGARALVGGRVRESWFASRSSGSTGEPFEVHYDPRAWALLKLLVKLRARRACGLRPGDRLALVDATAPDRAPSSSLERLGRLRHVSALQPAESVGAQLAQFQPTAIYGLPSVLIEAAKHLTRPVRARLVFTSGELLRPAIRNALEAAYGSRPLDVYGTSETKEIAWECASGNAHLNVDVVRLEALGASGESLPPGEEGALAATVLVNRAMPLLRYRTGDRGSLREDACPCGLAFPLVGVVSGRETDRLEMPDGRWVSPYALTCAVESVPGVLRYQVVQLEPERLRVRAVVPHDERTEAARRIPRAVRAATHPATTVDVEFVDRLDAGPNAKFRVVVARPAAPHAPSAEPSSPEHPR